jgi:hypothetical protein
MYPGLTDHELDEVCTTIADLRPRTYSLEVDA